MALEIRLALLILKILSSRLTVPKAKYGDESIYFDLKDIENTTGAWDIYGSDGPSPYNGFQVTSFLQGYLLADGS